MTQTTRQSTIIDTLPKAELHLHLEGSIRPETAVELAARQGTTLTVPEVIARYSYSNFAGFIDVFKWVTSFLRDPEDYALITRRLLEELRRQNVVYAEITISAGVMLRRMQNVEQNFMAIRETSLTPSFGRLRSAWIFDAVRQFGGDAATEVARAAIALRGFGVVAFGMGGDERSLPTAEFRSAFNLAREEGLRIVCHAGEIGGPHAVREAIELLGAERIGHGIAVMNDPELAKLLARGGVALENCLTSNICTGALAGQIGKPEATLSDHPLRHFMEQGVPVTLSTDDPALFHTDLLAEYSHAAAMGLSDKQLLELAEASFHAAFLPRQDRRQLLEDFRAAATASGLL